MGSLWNRSGTIERYADDLRAAGALAYFFDGGTTSPITVYQDAGESTAHTHPVVADANGRWPDIFIPYIVSYDVQVKTASGLQLTYTQRIPNPDPIDLTVTVPAENQVQTGMVHAELVNTTKAGYVRLNGRTMGNATSGGTERANADTEDLFEYLWTNLSNTIAAVSGGRGASAADDYAANKTITLPDCRGALFAGLDDMGNSAAGFYSGVTFATGSAVAAGSYAGSNTVTLGTDNLPAHSHTGSTSNDNATGSIGNESSHTHSVSGSTGSGTAHQHDAFINDPGHFHTVLAANVAGTAGGGPNPVAQTANAAADTDSKTTGVRVKSSSGGAADDKTATESAHTHSISVTSGGGSSHTHTFTPTAHSHTFTTNTQGSSTPFANLTLTRLVTWYIKL